VSEVGRESWEPPFDVFASAIPLQERLNGEPMAEVVETRTGVVRRCPEADLSGKLPENRIDILKQQPTTTFSDEEIRAAPPVGMFVAARCIPEQDFLRRGVKRHEARLAELCAADCEDTLLQVDIVAPHPKRFVDAQPGHSEKSEQAVEGPSAQPIGWS
jgi:hypothetical protein